MNLGQLRQRIIELWQDPAGRVRLLIGGGVVLAVAIAVAVGVFSQGQNYVPLFSRLDPRDASEVVARLEEEGIPYQLTGSGSTILVPENEVHRLRLQLAGEGLPSGGVVGMEVLDRFQFGATEFERRMNFLRALQGELTRTIEQIDAIDEARVHIVMPEERLFVSQRQPATAAVLVRLKPGRRLERDQVVAISRLVANSVEGLSPEDVTIVDAAGGVLSSGLEQGTDDWSVMSLQHLEITQRFQSELESSLQTLLEQVFGPGNVIARVNAQLNFDQTVVERDFFEPVDNPEALLRSVQELEEEFEGEAALGAAFPGTDTNIPIPTLPGAGMQDAQYRRNERIANYELNEIRERLVVAPGTVERLSVSVVINDQLTPEQIEAVQSTVQAAVGFDTDRNDQITVIGMPFDTTISDQLAAALEAERLAQEQAQQRMLYVYGAALGLALILFIIGLIVMRRSLARRRQDELLQERLRRAQLEEQQAALEAAAAAASDERLRKQQEIEAMVREKPDQVASVVRAWLADE